MAITEEDIDAFQQFAKQQIGNAATNLSLQQLLSAWEMKRELEETADAIRQGISDIEAGKGKPVAQAFADVRKKLGLVE
ncbi:MAG: hypothetical protein ACC645_13515 [Pirellulales bacterium]